MAAPAIGCCIGCMCAIEESDFTPEGGCIPGMGAMPGICACVESDFDGICMWPVSAIGIFIVVAGFLVATGFFVAAPAFVDVLVFVFFLAVAGFVLVVRVVDGFFFADF
ncbi:MAG TPA: hypothetical protein VFP26_10575 [Gemmatimonadaceae bacterium]|nr:hypothetical protein [Gemmatimonadaceae bacterium]